MGALPTLRAATDSEARGGDYFGPDSFWGIRGYPVKVTCSIAARDIDDVKQLLKIGRFNGY